MDEGTDSATAPGMQTRTMVGLAIAAVVLLVGGAIAAATSGGSDSVEASDGSSTTTAAGTDELGLVDETGATVPDTTPADGDVPLDDPGTSADPGPGDPATTVPGTAAPATTAAAAQDLGAAKDPGPTTPPRQGRYRYRTSSEGSADGQGVTTITDQSRSGGVVKQSVKLEGQNLDSTSDVEWSAAKVLVTKSVFSFGGSTGQCDWTPDYLQAVLPMAAGTKWEAKSSCTVTGFGVPINVQRSTSNVVSGPVRRQVAGEVLDVWVIESTDVITFATTTVNSKATTWFSPRHGLIVGSKGKTEGGDGTFGPDGAFSTELLNLQPE